jgi:hypothetical protein
VEGNGAGGWSSDNSEGSNKGAHHPGSMGSLLRKNSYVDAGTSLYGGLKWLFMLNSDKLKVVV